MRFASIILLGLFLTATTAFADGTTTTKVISTTSAAQCHTLPKKHVIIKRQIVAQPRYFVTMEQGSLKENLVRIGHNYGWDTVVWNAPEDYLWIGTTEITGDSLEEIYDKILIKYPLQARFYDGNRVLAIVPRNLP